MAPNKTRNRKNQESGKIASSKVNKDDRSNGQVSDSENERCRTCSKAVLDGEDGMCCYTCENWHHRECTDLTNDEYRSLQRGGNAIQWVCESCLKNDRKKKNENSKLEEMVSKVLSAITGLSERIARLEKSKEDMENKVEEIIDQKIQVKVDEALGELREIEKRKNNVILTNLPESEKETQEEKEEEEVKKVLNHFENDSNLTKEDIQIQKVFRLGKPVPGKRRLLKVELKNTESKEKVMKAASVLNQSQRKVELTKRTYVNADLTPKQRSVENDLRKELKTRIEKGEKNLQIKNGKICQRTQETDTQKETLQKNDN